MDNKLVTQADEDAADALYNLVSECQDKYEDWQLAFARHRIAERERCAQPTQSDAVLDGDAQTILYLLGVRHGREDERAKIAAEASQPKTVTVTVVSAADGKAIHKFKIDPTKKTIVRPEHSLFGYVFEPEEEQSK
jgi:hypothetical protein